MQTTRVLSLLLLVITAPLAGLVPQDPVSSRVQSATQTTIMPKITTALWFPNDAEPAVRFYVSVFADGKILQEARWPDDSFGPKGSLISATFRIAGQEVIAISGNSQSRFSEAMSLMVTCETQKEIDDYWQRLSADGKGQCGWTKDRFGVSWQIVPRELLAMMADKDTAKVKRVSMAMMQMQKLDLATLQKAYAGS